jgi:hypothetical protein
VYASTVHCRPDTEARRSRRIAGSATLTMEMSITTTITGGATSSWTWTGSTSAPGCGPPACPSRPSGATPSSSPPGNGNEHERLALLEAHRAEVTAKLAALQENLKLIDHKIDVYRGRLAAGDADQLWAPDRDALSRNA